MPLPGLRTVLALGLTWLLLCRLAPRVRTLVALTLSLIVAPAHAAEACDGLVESADDFVAEIACASAADTATTLTLTSDLDEDGQADGYIVDPVALAVQATFTG